MIHAAAESMNTAHSPNTAGGRQRWLWRLVRRNAWVMWMAGGFSAAGWHWNDWRFYAVLVPVCVLNVWANDSVPNAELTDAPKNGDQ